MGVLQESVDPLHVRKSLPSVEPLKESHGPRLISRSLFIHKLFVWFSCCLPSAGNVLFHLCGLCVCKVLTERGFGGVGGSECCVPWRVCQCQGKGSTGVRSSSLTAQDPADSSGSMVKDWKPPNSASHREGCVGSARSGQYFKDIHTHTHPTNIIRERCVHLCERAYHKDRSTDPLHTLPVYCWRPKEESCQIIILKHYISFFVLEEEENYYWPEIHFPL